MPLGAVVAAGDSVRPKVTMGEQSAAAYLVSRMFTDAIFSNDIRTIQLIINRIDGGLPRDIEVDDYQTQFSDCLNKIMTMTDGNQLKLTPDDTVMMGLCKSLYALATQDIYWDDNKGRMRKPSTDKKQERDAALRMILERTGGRKPLVAKTEQIEEIEEADWINALPGV